MKKVLTLCAVIGVLLGAAGLAFGQDETVGSVRKVEGQAFLVRAGQSQPADASQKLLLGDKLVTGADGSVGVLLRDDTSISLGPDSEVSIDEFMFAPVEGKLALGAKVAKGTAAFLTGKIAKLKPEAVRVETPTATIGVRGTRFLVQAQGQ